MISVNSEIGRKYFDAISSDCVVYEYPIEYASDNNQAFKENVSEECRKSKHKLEEILYTDGKRALMKKLCCPNLLKRKVYTHMPVFMKKLWSKVRAGK